VQKVAAIPLTLLLLLFCSAPAAAQKGHSKTAAASSGLDCLTCHADPAATSDSGVKTHSVHVDGEKFKNSVHGLFGCTDCHSDIKEYPHTPAPVKVNCATCHNDAVAAYERGVHGRDAKNKSSLGVPGCLDCHGNQHAILAASDPASPVAHANTPKTCSACHNEKFVMAQAGRSAQPALSYAQSVHGKAAAAGNQKAAVCTDCHRNHEILSARDAASPIAKFNVPQTCGQCHSDVTQQYNASIHGQAIQRGNWQAAVCTDCHGIHSIKQHLDPTSTVAAANLAQATCAQCHESVRLTQEFGVAGRRASSYLTSYHGMASKLGSQVVANCASCHGVHNILPSSDPRSTIHPSQLVATCGQCHPGASQKFALSKVHIDAPLSRDAGSLGTLYVRRAYTVIIGFTIGGMLLHNFLLWRRTARRRRLDPRRSIVRVSRSQRIQHLLLLISFFALAITGFALKYPESWLAGLLGWSEAVRRIGHRVAATVLLGVGGFHLWYISRAGEGRQLVRDFLPLWRDLRELRQAVRYNLGSSDQHPHFGRFSYAEKLEYWSLIWGTVLMGVTGLVLWFPVLIARVLPRWWLDIAAALHFYEAILAVLAIFVWHFYFVIFDPEVYPLNWSFWDGKVTEEYLQSHHPELREPQQTAPPALPSENPEREAAEQSDKAATTSV